MRRNTVAALGALVLASAALVAAPAGTRAASSTKVVVIVGPVAGMQSTFTNAGQAFAAAALKYTSNVTLLVTPNATWANVLPALQGANVVYYAGHGNGIPSPYHPADQTPTATEQNTADGFGLDPSVTYKGEYYIRSQVRLAPNAVVILNHGCYTAGNSEWGSAPASLTDAQHRVDNFAAGFIAAGARAVIAEALSDATWYGSALFTAHTTIDQLWRSFPRHYGNFSTFPSWRSTAPDGTVFTDAMDPCNPGACGTAGETRYRSLVSIPTLKTDDVVAGAPLAPPAPPASIGTKGQFVPLTPARILDTRDGTGSSGALFSGLARTFAVGGVGGVPNDATAVTGNLTVTGQTSAGYFALGPIATNNPTTSTLNFPRGDNRANGVTVALGTGGKLSLTFVGSSTATAHAIFDVTGYFTKSAGATYIPLQPNRLVDSRAGTGQTGLKASLANGVAATFRVTGRGADASTNVPATAVAVTGNLTVTNQSSGGYLALGPSATNSPTTSTLNFPKGDNRANGVTVSLSEPTTGGFRTLSVTFIGAAGSTTDVVFDVTGYFTEDGSGSVYVPLMPSRLVDSRAGTGQTGLKSSLANGIAATFQVTGRSTDPLLNVPANAVGVSGNLTVTNQKSGGYLALTPVATNKPSTSTLNFPLSDNRANGASVSLGTGGKLSVTFVGSSSATTDVIFDVGGYFAPPN